MKVADIFEARYHNRDAVRDAVNIMHDDTQDMKSRITQAEAEALIPKFIDHFGHPTWSEEDNGGIGIWQYQWEEWITNDEGTQHRWFIKIGWYQPSGRGIFNVTRHRHITDVKEASYHGLSGNVKCPRCMGRGWEWVAVGEDDCERDICWTCNGEAHVSVKDALKMGYEQNELEPTNDTRTFGERLGEASTLGNKFSSQVRDLINKVPSTHLHAGSFVTKMSYGQTVGALINILGEPDWESPDYGDDVPYWYLNNDTTVILVDVLAPRPGVFHTEVTAEYDPSGVR